MRGKDSLFLLCPVSRGITPAYAGKSYTQMYLATTARDHPRVCGEKAAAAAPAHNQSGSPPRMRGKEGVPSGHTLSFGITPAYAGKRSQRRAGIKRQRDHPRVCGEKTQSRPAFDNISGSPPRMRGKGDVVRRFEIAAGITPAYAGKRAAPSGSSMASWDHPRVCGEKRTTESLLSNCGGSPPRMRGKAVYKDIKRAAAGITPAYAGKSHRYAAQQRAGRDHPRVCGEKLNGIQIAARELGSPPRMRGKD